jgi:4-hydroxy-tetrahydrodipicolinate reductase
MRVGVVGAAGRMGSEVCRALVGRPGLELVAALDPTWAGRPLSEAAGPTVPNLTVTDRLEVLSDADVEVVVDFTRVDAARRTLEYCASSGIHAVVGTTGFSDTDLNGLAMSFAGRDAGRPNCVLAANFAIGAVLMMRFAELAAPWFESAEIIELHHRGKLDAPSGTALTTARRMAAAREGAGAGDFPPDATVTTVVESSRGGTGPGGIQLHSVRLDGLVAHQEVLLGSIGQTLTIRHDSSDRISFMEGVVLAVHAVPDRPGLTVGLEPLLGL